MSEIRSVPKMNTQPFPLYKRKYKAKTYHQPSKLQAAYFLSIKQPDKLRVRVQII